MDMVGTKPEHWRIATPILAVLNFLGISFVGVLTWFMIRTIDEWDKHLEKIDTKFEKQEIVNFRFQRDLALVQGQCCKRSLSQSQMEDNGG